ncbi:MAG: potassium transporter TrkG [Desulforegulaceae bacterium]|nr:potassium transporter TrkG [Desulforegulaceae bacterium]
MQTIKKSKRSISAIGAEGGLLVFSLFPFLPVLKKDSLIQSLIWSLPAFISFSLCILCASTLTTHPKLAKKIGFFSALLCFLSFYENLIKNHFAFLFALISLISICFILKDYKLESGKLSDITTHEQRCFKRILWGSFSFTALFLICLLPFEKNLLFSSAAVHLSIFVNQIIFLRFARSKNNKILKYLYIIYGILTLIFIVFSFIKLCFLIPFFIALLNLLILSREKKFYSKMNWLEVILDHPARILTSGFLFLCTLGAFLLFLPISSSGIKISFIDAAFTSVSAVCVTGLIVLDTSLDFSIIGQFFILLLIQLGGLGIMTITAAALYTVGQRLSLKHEKIIASTANTDHKTLFSSLKQIVLFTFIVEALGAVILSTLFTLNGESFTSGVFKGIFTAVSAFCNAGFALQSDNLLGYNTNPLILQTIATLIILGGIAPATTFLIPKWIKGQKIPLSAYIPLTTTLILLSLGTICVLLFEWNGFLSEFNFFNKLSNAWFQSATLRTAGFNSVDLNSVSQPMLITMIALMFIGGSPGSTAGGVKTTAFALVFITFIENIKGKKNIVVKSRTIPQESINKAITAIVAGLMLWFFIVIMLEITQTISPSQILFEAASALGTVGLSIGATALLDEIGKVIIMTTMFIGRIGSVTLFMFLREEARSGFAKWPEEKINIT